MLLSRESLILLDFVYWSFKVFKGNKDKDSIVYHEITPPIQAIISDSDPQHGIVIYH